MRTKILLIFLFAILCVNSAAAFSIAETSTETSVCAGNTLLITDSVTGAGSYSVSTSGSASSFTTAVPSAFISSDTKTIYSYVTPSSKITKGSYDLTVKAESNGEVKEIVHKISVTDCHTADLSVESVSTCPCQAANLIVTLKNSGKYYEVYNLRVEGLAKGWTTLSQSTIGIDAGETKTINAVVKATCDIYGKYDISIIAEADTSPAVATAKGVLEIKPCYEYSISVPDSYYSICENENLAVQLAISNQGTADNSYKINLYGPTWANIKNNALSASQGSNASTDILLAPGYGIKGNFTIKAEALSVYGDVLKSEEASINVRKCYDSIVSLEKQEDRMCNAVSNTYAVMIKNTGEFANTYNIEVSGADFATASKNMVSLEAGKEETLALDVHPSFETSAAVYDIKVKAVDPASKAESEDAIKITTASIKECYEPAINSKQESVSLSKDSSATAMFVIENKGTDNATYIIDASGTAASFAEVNPGIITVLPGKAEVVYLYIAPALQQAPGDYESVITVRLKDTTILSSKTITIEVKGESTEAINVTATNETAAAAETNEAEENFFTKILKSISDFFTKLFSVEVKPEITSDIIENASYGINETAAVIANESIVTEAIETVNETEVAEVNITIEEINVTVSNETEIVEEALNETIEVAANESIAEINVTIESNETVVIANESVEEIAAEEAAAAENKTLTAGELEEQLKSGEISESEARDYLASMGLNNDTIDLFINQINLEKSPEKGIKEAVSSFFSAYKTYITASIIIIILLLIIVTGFWKKIVEFFEEEPENGKKKNGKKK